MWSELSDDEDIAGPQFSQPELPHKLDEEGMDDVPNVANDDEDSAGP